MLPHCLLAAVTESQCRAGAGDWTTGCGCDRSGDPGYAPCNTSSPEYGCYNANDDYKCDCSISEGACVGAGGSWMTGCSCTAEALPPPAPAPPPIPMDGGRILVTLDAECPSRTYSESFVRLGILSAAEEITRVHQKWIDLFVNDKCVTPRGAEGAAFTQLILAVSCTTASHTKYVEEKIRAAFADAQSTSFLLHIHAISTPVIKVECPKCEHVRNAHVIGSVSAVAALLCFGCAVFCITRRVYRHGGVRAALLGREPRLSSFSTTEPYRPPLASNIQ